MKKITVSFAVIIILAIGTVITLSAFKKSEGAENTYVTKINLDDWSKESKEAIDMMNKKYGEANEKTPTMMVWYNTGPWKKTIIHSKAMEHNFPKRHKDVIQQFIDYKVPVAKYSQIAEFDGSVICERTNGQVSATCDKEDMNFLAINVTNDVATGKRSPKEAREFYTKTAMRYMKGEKDAYTQKFQFTVAKGGTADPDKMAEMDDMIKEVGKEGK